MLMSEADKMRIKAKGTFLIRKGYRVRTDAYGVEFDNGQMTISVFYERYDNHQDILLKFPNRNSFYLHFMALVLGQLETKNKTPIEILLMYMEYLERNYDKLMNEQYCEQCMDLVWKEINRKQRERMEENMQEVQKEEQNVMQNAAQTNMNNKIETPEERKKGNLWSAISLICFCSRYIFEFIIVLALGMANVIIEEQFELLDIAYTLEEATFALCSMISIALAIAALVIIIYVRVKYPKNIFGKVLMWFYIVAFIMYVVLTIAVIIAIGIACGACLNECEGMAKLVIESIMLC